MHITEHKACNCGGVLRRDDDILNTRAVILAVLSTNEYKILLITAILYKI